MQKQEDGSIFYKTKAGNFIFEANNYLRHCQKREILKSEWFLNKIEETFNDPDIVTKNINNKREKIYYRVYKKISSQELCVIKVPTVKINPISQIKTAIDFLGAPWVVVNIRVEEIIWKKQNSLIISAI